ncbi:hypothetical protein [Microlunatus speluncae]|uniref:hypothetical protein n=1 Tax=Microlunatus speluncae TaxID=2594267 RepID=UPI0012661CEA|nr:hypothetical protein [Microlunatus speluncae]
MAIDRLPNDRMDPESSDSASDSTPIADAPRETGTERSDQGTGAIEDISFDELQQLADVEEAEHSDTKSDHAESDRVPVTADPGLQSGSSDRSTMTFDELRTLADEAEARHAESRAIESAADASVGHQSEPSADTDDNVVSLSEASVENLREPVEGIRQQPDSKRSVDEQPSEGQSQPEFRFVKPGDLKPEASSVAIGDDGRGKLLATSDPSGYHHLEYSAGEDREVRSERTTGESVNLANDEIARQGVMDPDVGDSQERNPAGLSGGTDSSGASQLPESDATDSDIEVSQPQMSQDYYSNIPPVALERYLVRDPDKPTPIFDGPPTRDQVVQGSVGDCGIIATIGAVAGQRPDVIQSAIREIGNGKFDVILHETDGAGHLTGGTRVHQVDDVLPVNVSHRDRPVAGAEAASVGWPAILEKVVAAEDQGWSADQHRVWQERWEDGAHSYGDKHAVDDDRRMNGLPPSPDFAPLGYNRLDLGSTSYQQADLMARLTGVEAEVCELPNGPRSDEQTIRELSDRLDENKPVIVGTRGRAAGELFPPGIEPGHAYEVVQVDQDMIQLRNPWGCDHPSPMDAKTFRSYYQSEYATLK